MSRLEFGPRRPSSAAASQTVGLGPHALTPSWLGSPELAPSCALTLSRAPAKPRPLLRWKLKADVEIPTQV